MGTESLTSGQKAAFSRLRNEIKKDFDELLKDLESKKDDIERSRTLLLVDDEDGNSLETQISEARDNANTKLDEINELFDQIQSKHNLLTDPNDGLSQEIEITHNNINQAYEDSLELMEKFKKSSKRLYGVDNDGLENDLKQLAEDYTNSLNSNENRSKELLVQIEDALSGSMNVELAKAFQEQKTSYKWPKNGWAGLFIVTISSMIYLGYDAQLISTEGSQYLYDIGKRLMIFGPLVWLALFSSKQQSQNKRLEEEYSHKEAVAKTYVGHKRQLEKLTESTEKDQLLIQLAKTTIETIDFNPSSTLERQNPKSDLPTSELMDLAKKAIDKIGK